MKSDILFSWMKLQFGRYWVILSGLELDRVMETVSFGAPPRYIADPPNIHRCYVISTFVLLRVGQ